MWQVLLFVTASACSVVLVAATSGIKSGSSERGSANGWLLYPHSVETGATVITVKGYRDADTNACKPYGLLTFGHRAGQPPEEAEEIAFNPSRCEWQVMIGTPTSLP